MEARTSAIFPFPETPFLGKFDQKKPKAVSVS